MEPITTSKLSPVGLTTFPNTDSSQFLHTVSSMHPDNDNSDNNNNNNNYNLMYGLNLRDNNPETTTGMTSDDLEFLRNILSSRSDGDSTNPSTFSPGDLSSFLEALGSDPNTGVYSRSFLHFLENLGSSVVQDAENVVAPLATDALSLVG